MKTIILNYPKECRIEIKFSSRLPEDKWRQVQDCTVHWKKEIDDILEEAEEY